MLRNNMWVMTPDGIGIVYTYNEPVSTIHLVDADDGTTFAEVFYSSNQVRQATYEEIPECRRGASKEWFYKRGYV